MRKSSSLSRASWAAVLLVLASCSTVPKTPSNPKAEGKGTLSTASEFGTPPSGGTVQIEPEEQPEESPQAFPLSEGVHLVLGPGWIRAWAGSGVLLELAEQGIPIRSIHASEMSALVASLYAADPRPGVFAWKLQRLREDCIEMKNTSLMGLLSDSEVNDGKCLREFLKAELPTHDLAKLAVPLWVASPTSQRTNFVEKKTQLTWVHEGPIDSVVLESLSFPGLIHSGIETCGTLCAGAVEVFPLEDMPQTATTLVIDFSDPSEAGRHTNKKPKDKARGSALDDLLNRERHIKNAIRNRYIDHLSAISTGINATQGPSQIWLRPIIDGQDPFEPGARTELQYQGRQAIKKYIASLRTTESSTAGETQK